jgi:hypothetical protein
MAETGVKMAPSAIIGGTRLAVATALVTIVAVLAAAPGAIASSHPSCAGKISGTRHRDVITARGSHNCVTSRHGNDHLRGSKVADWLRAGPGRDVIRVRGGGTDVVSCGPGKDIAKVDRHDIVHGCEQVRRPRTPTRTLKVSVNGPGTIKGPGIDCPGDCTSSFQRGKTVALTSSPGTQAELSGWQGSCTGESPTCQVTMNSAQTAGADFRTTGSEEPPPSDGCEIDPATMTAPNCHMLRSDTGDAAPRAGLWGSVDCQNSSRATDPSKGGDPSPEADGTPQPDGSYRDLSVLDGDDFWGERCELGQNERRYGINVGSQTNGTFELYKPGDHKLTFFSERYPNNFDTNVSKWQTVMQMKQTQPYDDGPMGPQIELDVRSGRLMLIGAWAVKWSAPAPANGVWVRYAMDVVYSANPDVGSMQLYADLNGDGDFSDTGEISPVVHMATLAIESGPGGYGVTTGDAIPSHLRMGIYHDPSISCPGPNGCSVDVDNVQVLDAG